MPSGGSPPSPRYAAAFATAFSDPDVTRERLEAALATFQRLIVADAAPFDRWIAGSEDAISEAAKSGFDLFNGRAGCAGCHSGWTFTDNSFHDIGVGVGTDTGRGRLKPNSVALTYAFKTPTLREVGRRGPYMHDGSVATLDAVIDLYDRGGIERPSRSRSIKPLHLSRGRAGQSPRLPGDALDEHGPGPALAELTEAAPRP